MSPDPDACHLYSPESSDGTSDWPSRLGIMALAALTIAVLAGVLWLALK